MRHKTERHITQAWVAKHARMRPATLTLICVNKIKYLPIDSLNNICSVLNCKLEDIMEFVPDTDIDNSNNKDAD